MNDTDLRAYEHDEYVSDRRWENKIAEATDRIKEILTNYDGYYDGDSIYLPLAASDMITDYPEHLHWVADNDCHTYKDLVDTMDANGACFDFIYDLFGSLTDYELIDSPTIHWFASKNIDEQHEVKEGVLS